MEDNNTQVSLEEARQNLKDKFKRDYVNSVSDRVRLWFLVKRVYRQKIGSLWEAHLDKLFFESNYPNILGYSDADDRKALMDERQKPPANQNEYRINELEEKISKAKAVKQAYRKNEEFISELKTYIKMLELWMNQGNQN